MSFDRPWLKNYTVRYNLDYPLISLYEYMEQNIKKPDATAIVFLGQEITYRKLLENINRVATAIAARGIKKGDRIALMMPNCPQYIYTYYAAMRLGVTVTQVNPLYTPKELEFLIKDSGSKLLFGVDAVYPTIKQVKNISDLQEIIIARLKGTEVDGEVTWYNDLLEKYEPNPPAVQISPKEDIAVFQYTGGTTGFPKGAMLTHFNLVANCVQVREHIGEWREKNGDKQVYSIGVLPYFHSYGMTCSMNAGLAANETIIVLPMFDITMLLNAIKQYKPALFPAVPTIYNTIANHPDADKYNVDCIEVCNSGAAPMPLELQALFQQRTGAKLLEGYGLSEASPVTHSNPYNGIRKAGSIGPPYPDTDCKIVDLDTGTRELPVGEEGELILKGPQVMFGYWNRPEETAQALRDGWLYTGDIAKMDEDGYFYITDRKKDMIISGGYNVYPREVDEVLFEHPKVLEATSIGIPHEHYGEVVKAFVVLKEGMTATAEEIIEFCKERLARYKVPRAIEFRDSLPKSNVGKILRRVLKDEEKQKQSMGG
ncbi:MAG: long-chain fatty acid--CoA ligase [Dethiobacter sp.]|nr:long-chain fatty acid--CoA ligase [Dethiobacter sp.]